MPRIREWIQRLWGTLRGTRRDDDLREELKLHLELAEQDMRRRIGSVDAPRVARLQAGSITQAMDALRDQRGLPWLADLWHDTRHAIRLLRRSPTFAAAALVTLALGIGANTAIFSVVQAVLLRPLPYKDADRLVRIRQVAPQTDASSGPSRRIAAVRWSELIALRARAQTLSHIGIHLQTIMTLTHHDEALRLEGSQISPAVFQMLGAHPFLGRAFAPREELPGTDPVVILSHILWQRNFASDPRIVGQTVLLDGRGYLIIGVMGREFHFPDIQTEFWIPFVAPTTGPASLRRFVPIARLKDGVSIQAAAVDVNSILQQLQDDEKKATSMSPPPRALESPEISRAAGPPQGRPERSRASEDIGRAALAPLSIQCVRIQDELVAPVRPTLIILAVAVGVVLLIACANVGGLLLARTAVRQREIAIRLALGCGRGRLVRQLLTESVLIGLLGAMMGVGLAVEGVRFLRTFAASLPRRDLGPMISFPRLEEIRIDASVLVFAVSVAVLTGVLFGLGPALVQSRPHHINVLRVGVSSRFGGFNRFWRRQTLGCLVIAEIAMAMVLVVAGGLLIHSLMKLSRVDPGYDPTHVLTFQVGFPMGRYSAVQLTTFKENVVARLRALPATRSAGYAQSLPMVQNSAAVPLHTAPSLSISPPPPVGSRLPPDFPNLRIVSRDFLSVMRIRLIAGRGFSENDRAEQPRVMLINRVLVRSGFLGQRPLGKKVYVGFTGTAPWEIVGIVDDVREGSLDQEPDPQIFVDYRQLPDRQPPYYAVRVNTAPASIVSSIREIIRELDPMATVDNIATMEQLVSNSMSRRRLYAVLLGTFAGVAVVLAAVGLYGVVANAVAQRTHEIGIRMAVGAQPTQVIGLVLRQSGVLIILGIGLGVVGAATVTRHLEWMLFGLTPLDATTFVTVSVMFAAVAALASYVPARRAANVDPLVALRYE
jgi:putative ABC transport system permease protein